MDILFLFYNADMRYLPVVTVVIWLGMILGYMFAPGILLQPQVKFPLILMLGILVPVCFWTLQRAGKRIGAVMFIAIFLFNTGVPAYGLWRNSTIKTSLEEYAPNGIDPQMARLLVYGDTGEERRMAAKILYEKFGVKLPFKGEGEAYLLYSPDKVSRDKFVENHDGIYRAKTAIDNLAYQQISIAVVILLQLGLFLGMLVFLILYDRTPATALES